MAQREPATLEALKQALADNTAGADRRRVWSRCRLPLLEPEAIELASSPRAGRVSNSILERRPSASSAGGDSD